MKIKHALYRIVLKLTAWILGSLIIVVSLVLGLLHTPWGRGWIKNKVISIAEGSINGKLEIGDIEGFLLHRPVIRNISILDDQDLPIIRVESIAIGYNSLSLLGQTFHASEIKILEPRIGIRSASDGSWNIANLVKKSDKAEQKTPSDWKVWVDHLEVLGGHVGVTPAGQKAHTISNISFELQAQLGRSATQLKLVRLAARVDSHNLNLTADASLTIDDSTLLVDALSLKAGSSFFRINKCTLSSNGNLYADFAAHLSKNEIRLLIPEMELKNGLEINGSCSRTSKTSSFDVRIDGKLANAKIAANSTVTPDLSEARGSIVLDQFNPKEFHSSAPPGHLRSITHVNFPRADSGWIRGGIHGKVEGVLGKVPIKKCTYRARLEGNKTIQSNISLQTPLGAGHLDATLLLDRFPVAIQDAKMKGNFSGFDLFGISGEANVNLKANGPLDDIAVNGDLALNNLSLGKSRARFARAELSIIGLPMRAEGQATFLVTGIQHQDHHIGSVSGLVVSRGQGRTIDVSFRSPDETSPYGLEGQVKIERSQEQAIVLLDSLTIKTKNVNWSGNKGKVIWSPNGNIEADKFVLTSEAGQISADFNRWIGADQEETIATHVCIEKLSLKKLSQIMIPGILPNLCGHISLDIHAKKKGGRIKLDGRGSSRGLCVIPGSPTLDGTFQTAMVGNELQFEVSATDSKVGRLTASANVHAPSNPFKTQGWIRQGPGALRKLNLELGDIDLKSISNLLGHAGVKGKLSGAVSVEKGIEKGAVSLQIDKLDVESIANDVKGDLRAILSKSQLTISVNARDRQDAVLHINSRLRVPELRSGFGNRLEFGLRNLKSIDASLKRVQIPNLEWLLPGAPRISGEINAEVGYREEDPVISVMLGIRDLHIPALTSKLTTEIEAELGIKESEIKLTSSLDEKRIVEAQTSLGAGYHDLLERGIHCLSTATLSGHMSVDYLPLRQLSDALSLKIPVDGALIAQASVQGTLIKPHLRIQSVLNGASVGKFVFDELGLSAETLQDAYGLRLHGRQRDGGIFELDARFAPSTIKPSSLVLTASDFRIRPLFLAARSVISKHLDIDGMLDADLRWTGGPEYVPIAGWFQIQRGELRLPGGLRTMRDLEIEARIKTGWIQVNGTARSGAGYISIAADIGASEWPPSFASADVSTRRFPVPAGGALVSVDLDAQLDAGLDNDLWRMTSKIRHATVHLPEKIGDSLHDTTPLEDVVWQGASPSESNPAEKQPIPTIKSAFAARMRIHSGEPVIVRNQDVEAQLSIDLDTSFIDGSTSLTGNVEVIGGYATVFERRYQIINGKATFKGVIPPDPHIDLVLLHDIGTLKLMISVQGTAKRPKVTLSSDPAIYDQSQLLAFVLGRNPDDPLRDTKSLEDRALNVASGLLLSKVQSEVKRALPIDTLRLDTDQKQGRTAGRFIVGKWVTEDVFVAYRYRLGSKESENVNEANLSYRLARDWVLEGTYGDRGKGGVDILWVKRF